ncbi:helix-turn-helix transcriptional regulator [Streptomyces montanisoli]|uniref:Response regulator transcription factor n=1 Tax=Streptomyces montanisoli TaxID=2798581 RepID=A0A940MD23_9ACTN|nr:LuxR C-terminal-related transcriptional regulator [Streptomyces montanisoli]MBP0460754.1 response regulator transcription factor [Streptomyces montanisoli]
MGEKAASGVLSARDDARMLDLTAQLLLADDPEEIWARVGLEIMSALPGTAVLCKDDEWTATAGRVLAWPVTRRPTAAQLACIRGGYPFADGGRAIPDGRPLLASGVAGRGPWDDSEMHEVTRALFGTRDVLALRYDGGGPGPVRGMLVHCSEPGGSARERAYVARMHPLLRGMDSHVRLLRRCSPAPAVRAGACEYGLTPRERAVLVLLAEALPATAIGRRLCVSVRTVHKHTENIYRKLGTRDRLATVLRAQAAGLLPASGRI